MCWAKSCGWNFFPPNMKVHEYEIEMANYLYQQLSSVPGVVIYGPPPSTPRGRAALCAFNVEGLHATDVSTLLDASGDSRKPLLPPSLIAMKVCHSLITSVDDISLSPCLPYVRNHVLEFSLSHASLLLPIEVFAIAP